jgi:hypothetical protein
VIHLWWTCTEMFRELPGLDDKRFFHPLAFRQEVMRVPSDDQVDAGNGRGQFVGRTLPEVRAGPPVQQLRHEVPSLSGVPRRERRPQRSVHRASTHSSLNSMR